MNKNNTLALILSVLILSFLTAYWILAWTEPSTAPPESNISDLLDTSATAQTKSGDLTVNALTTLTGALTVNTSGNDKLLFSGTQASPHTIWLGDSKGVRFWDSVNGELMKITNTGDVYISGLTSCNTVDTDATGKMSCGVDDVNDADADATNEIQNIITDKGLQRDASNNFGIMNCTDGQIVKYNASNQWICSSDTDTGIQGGGTINYLTKFTNADPATIGNSQIFDDGTNVGIGDSNPAEKLTISGNAVITGSYYGAESGAPSSYIWAISPTYPNYGIYYSSGSPDIVQYMWNGTSKIDMGIETGNIQMDGDLTVNGNSNLQGDVYDSGGYLVLNDTVQVNKTGTYYSNIIFPAETNDRGYIAHYENNNTGVMRFASSDDVGVTDYFEWGRDSGSGGWGEGGTFTQVAKLDNAGNFQMDGDLTVSGGNIKTNYFDVNAGDDYGIRFWNGSTSYTLTMGDDQQDYGWVTDYSMHMNMGTTDNRGFTWGYSDTNVVASLEAETGHFRTRGVVYAENYIKSLNTVYGNAFTLNSAVARYYSVTPSSCTGTPPDTADIRFNTSHGYAYSNSGAEYLFCPVNLPHGARFSNIICNGNYAGDTWTLRALYYGSTNSLNVANETLNSTDSSISHVVDNDDSYSYVFIIYLAGTNHMFYGCRIVYTITQPYP